MYKGTVIYAPTPNHQPAFRIATDNRNLGEMLAIRDQEVIALRAEVARLKSANETIENQCRLLRFELLELERRA